MAYLHPNNYQSVGIFSFTVTMISKIILIASISALKIVPEPRHGSLILFSNKLRRTKKLHVVLSSRLLLEILNPKFLKYGSDCKYDMVSLKFLIEEHCPY